MEAAEDIVTRSPSPIDDYRPMNHQRKPAVGDLIRIRIQPDKKHENMHTHGWITLVTANNNWQHDIVWVIAYVSPEW